ncbi:MAG: electron transfer flavoprotein subunit beta/FixA family protein [Eubacteriales bacterium]|nr:electron transfer flavoprotein subunit beta/FixA family protein [Eubacteriales bacterium]
MNIIVCIKQVPNTKEVRINTETNNIIREGVPSILNPADANAIEAALSIREKKGGTVCAVSMGPQQSADVLQEALDMGADRGILLSDRMVAGSDTLATGYALSAMIKTLNADLVLCGAEAIDGCTGQVGPIIAENLGWPQFTYVNSVEITNGCLKIKRDMRDTFELYECKLPAVVCVLKGINIPRKSKDSDKRPEIISVKEIDAEEEYLGMKGSPTRVSKIVFSGKSMSSFVSVDGSLPVRSRIRILMNGGMSPKKISFVRGEAKELADRILEDEVLRGQIVK